MRRFVRWTLFVVAGLLAIGVALWAWSRLQPLSAEQREAVALLQPSPEPEGRNAFDALWLLGRGVPAARLHAVADADMERIRAELAGSRGAVPSGADTGAAAGARDLRPTDADRELFCELREACLRRVRADPAGYAALVERNRALLDRIAALSGTDYFRNRLPPDPRAPMPESWLARFGVTDAAQAFASGDIDGGLVRACEGVATWRRLGARADSLVVRFLGASLATDGYGALLARMLAELPREHRLPSACDAALAPVAEEDFSVCEAFRGEYAMISIASEVAIDPGTAGTARALLGRLVYDPERSRALVAGNFAQACTEAGRSSLAADRLPAPRERARSTWRMECVANAAGCILADISSPAYVDYAARALDAGARLELLRGVAAVRGAGDAQAREAALRRYWAGTRTRDRELRFVDGGTAVEMRELYTARGQWWRLPLWLSASTD